MSRTGLQPKRNAYKSSETFFERHGTGMKKEEIIAFFDQMAPQWDADMIRDDAVIDTILHHAEVKAGNKVLDVACGTGVLFPDYLNIDVELVTGVDISPEMVHIASEKYAGEKRIQVLCNDVETMELHQIYDNAVVYNAFPHFPNPDGLLQALVKCVKVGGTVTIAHGMSRERINQCHEGSAKKVSLGLMPVEDLAELVGKYLDVTTVISDDKMYQVVGKKISHR